MNELSDLFSDDFEISALDIKKSKIASDMCALLAFCKISRSEIAERLGKERSSITRLLSGKQNLETSSILEFVIALGYDYEVIFTSKKYPRPKQPWQIELEEYHYSFIQLLEQKLDESISIDFHEQDNFIDSDDNLNPITLKLSFDSYSYKKLKEI